MYNSFVQMSGSISIKIGKLHYSLVYPTNGWLAAELVQYLGDVIESSQPEVAVLKLLGYTMEMAPGSHAQRADEWVEIDLERREVVTNSPLIRKAVDQEEPTEEEPFNGPALRRIHALLDKYDFTVRLRK